jgi:hypothetical protein
MEPFFLPEELYINMGAADESDIGELKADINLQALMLLSGELNRY